MMSLEDLERSMAAGGGGGSGLPQRLNRDLLDAPAAPGAAPASIAHPSKTAAGSPPHPRAGHQHAAQQQQQQQRPFEQVPASPPSKPAWGGAASNDGGAGGGKSLAGDSGGGGGTRGRASTRARRSREDEPRTRGWSHGDGVGWRGRGGWSLARANSGGGASAFARTRGTSARGAGATGGGGARGSRPGRARARRVGEETVVRSAAPAAAAAAPAAAASAAAPREASAGFWDSLPPAVAARRPPPAAVAARGNPPRAARWRLSTRLSRAAEASPRPTNAAGFKEWCRAEMLALNGSDDTTLVDFLVSLPSAGEVTEYVQLYLGDDERAAAFGNELIRIKRTNPQIISGGGAAGGGLRGRRRRVGGRGKERAKREKVTEDDGASRCRLRENRSSVRIENVARIEFVPYVALGVSVTSPSRRLVVRRRAGVCFCLSSPPLARDIRAAPSRVSAARSGPRRLNLPWITSRTASSCRSCCLG